MTRQEAIAALRHWASPGIVPASVIARLDAEAEANESPLDVAVRLACGRGVPRPAAFDHLAVSRLVAEASLTTSEVKP